MNVQKRDVQKWENSKSEQSFSPILRHMVACKRPKLERFPTFHTKLDRLGIFPLQWNAEIRTSSDFGQTTLVR